MLLRFIKLIHIFMSIIEKKIQVDENGHKYILFRVDVCFIEYLLAVEIDEKRHTDRDLIFKEKRQNALEKNSVVNLLELTRVKKAILQIIKPAE